MAERVLIVLVLAIVGFAAYTAFARFHVRKAAYAAGNDALLTALRPGIPTVVYFTTPDCAPCKTVQGPALDRLQTELGDGVQVVRVNAYDDPDTATRWGVFSVPTTFILDRQGQPREVNHGVADADKLRRQLQAVVIR